MGRQGTSGVSGSRQAGSGNGQRGQGARRPPLTAVYRRRRLLAGVLLLLVLALLAGGVVAVSGAFGSRQAEGSGAPAGESVPGADGIPSGSPSPASTSGRGCDPSRVSVTAATDQTAYAAGEIPMLSLQVTNGNKVPCEVNMGTSQMEFLIISGSDRIFSSRDCQAESSDLMKTIAPGQSETANFPWPRNRSVPGCVAIEAVPGAGGAYYVFTARLGNALSPKAVFQLN